MSGATLSDEQYKKQVRAVYVATGYLTIITIAEVVLALTMHGKISSFALTTFFTLLTFWKAYYILGEFMHIKYEKRTLVLSLGLPLVLLIWMLIAYIHDGAALFKAMFDFLNFG